MNMDTIKVWTKCAYDDNEKRLVTMMKTIPSLGGNFPGHSYRKQLCPVQCAPDTRKHLRKHNYCLHVPNAPSQDTVAGAVLNIAGLRLSETQFEVVFLVCSTICKDKVAAGWFQSLGQVLQADSPDKNTTHHVFADTSEQKITIKKAFHP